MKEFFKTDDFFEVQLIGTKWMIAMKNHGFLEGLYSRQPEECKLHSLEDFITLTVDAHTSPIEWKSETYPALNGEWVKKKMNEFFSLDRDSPTCIGLEEVLEFYDVEASDEGLAWIITFMMMHLLPAFGGEVALLAEMGIEEIADLFNELILIAE